jgi:glutamate-ammonia-ligase adenylyltransferase
MSAPDLPLDLFDDARSGERNLRAIHELFLSSGSRSSLEDFSRSILTALRSSPDPDLGVANLLRFCEVTVSPASLFTDLVEHPVLLDILMRVLGNSRFFADILVREPALFRWLTASAVLNSPLTREELQAEVDRCTVAFTSAERRLDALRRLSRRQLLRIGMRDVLDLADITLVTAELSMLADVTIDAAVRWSWDQVREKGGEVPEIPFAVIGLGKLGGNELNYSSDIDLLFLYGDPPPGMDEERVHAFFHNFGERVVQHLSRSTGEGHLFRVDMRLRPESGAGPLARSLESYLLYYESRGELWERQMLLKARPVGGDRALGEAFLRALEPFVYPRAFLEHPAEAITRMKARIESTLGDATNVKLMPGGIRDIEFIVQALQLLHGGKNPGLRTGTTLAALPALEQNGLLTGAEAKGLARAYRFYRLLEHRLQIMQNTQTHSVPRDSRGRGLLARRMGLSSAIMFDQDLGDHLSVVRGVFRKVMSAQAEPSAAGLEAAIDGALPEEATHRTLADYGFRDVRQALRNMRSLAFGSTLTGRRETDNRARSAFRQVATVLFNDLSSTPDPDLTLQGITLIAAAQKFPGSFFAQLRDQRFRRFIVDTCAMSPRFARLLGDHPAILESVALDPAGADAAESTALPVADDLVAFKTVQELRAGLRYVLGFSQIEECTADIAGIADVVVGQVYEAGLTGRGRPPRLALFALGKLGSRELMLDADVDLLFVSDAGTAAARSRLERMASACVNALSEVSERGRLYEVDVRLRPEGRNAPLVADRAAYRTYLAQRASLWERQSLTRLRYICGDEDLGRQVLDDVRSFVFGTPLPAGWIQTTVDMRRKMESRTRTRGEVIIDFKLGAGGMVDVEFLTQMMLLQPGLMPEDVRGRDVFTLLRAVPARMLTADERSLLLDAYRFYRRLELLLRITLEERGSLLPVGEHLERLARCAGRISPQELTGQVTGTMSTVRTLFLAVAHRLEQQAGSPG